MKSFLALLVMWSFAAPVQAAVSESDIRDIIKFCGSEKTYRAEAECYRDELGYLVRHSQRQRNNAYFLRMDDRELWQNALANKVGACSVHVNVKSTGNTYQLGNKNGQQQTTAFTEPVAIIYLRNFLRTDECNLKRQSATKSKNEFLVMSDQDLWRHLELAETGMCSLYINVKADGSLTYQLGNKNGHRQTTGYESKERALQNLRNNISQNQCAIE